MAQINFPVATVAGQTFEANTGVLYTYVGTPPNGYWSGTFGSEGTDTLDARYLKKQDGGVPQTIASTGLKISDNNSDTIVLNSNGNITATKFIGDGSELTNLPDGGSGVYLPLAGGNLTGDLTLGTDKITLNADGSAIFSGATRILGQYLQLRDAGNTSSVHSFAPDGSASLCLGNLTFGFDGSIFSKGALNVGNTAANIAADGSAYFGSQNIVLNADGSAQFGGSVVVDVSGVSAAALSTTDGLFSYNVSNSSSTYLARFTSGGGAGEVAAIKADGSITASGTVTAGGFNIDALPQLA